MTDTPLLIARRGFFLATTAALAGCAPPLLSTADQMVDIEASDRVRRFERLSAMSGVNPPVIEQILVPAGAIGASRPIPVIRVVFDERAFFRSGQARPLPSATPIMDIMAENMRRDVPDVRMTLLGHTDAVGSDASNVALSQQRAYEVMARLVRQGVNPGQLGTVAIGKEQPIASNETADGRARNRRVEFLISANEAANLDPIERRPINASYLRTASRAAPSAAAAPVHVQFLKPTYTGPADFAEAPAEQRTIALTAVKPITLSQAKIGQE